MIWVNPKLAADQFDAVKMDITVDGQKQTVAFVHR